MITNHATCVKKRPLAVVCVFVLMLAAATTVYAQADGTPPKPQEPPSQQQPPRGGSQGSGGSSGGVGVGINVNGVLHELFKKRWHAKLEASTLQAQVGQPITFSTTVNPATPELSYEFHWKKDSAEQKNAPSITHAYDSPGEYKVRVIVYGRGQKLATSNEVRIIVAPAPSGVAVATNGPPTSVVPRVLPPVETKPPVSNPVSAPPATIAGNPPKPPDPKIVTPPPSNTTVANPASTVPASTTSASTVPPPRPKPATGPRTATVKPPPRTPRQTPVPPASTEVLAEHLPEPPSYSVSLHLDRSVAAAKPVNVLAELQPIPPNKGVQYCFSWGDGASDCQGSASATHVYRAEGKYRIAVEAFADQRKLAASEAVVVDAVVPLWTKIWPFAVIFLAVLAAASYGVRKVRKMAKAAVTVRCGPGRHSIDPPSVQTGEALRIRCVPSAVVSKITFLSSDQSSEDKKEAAHV